MTDTTTKWTFRLLPFGEKDCDPGYQAGEFLGPRLVVSMRQPIDRSARMILRWVVYPASTGPYGDFGSALEGMLRCASVDRADPRAIVNVHVYSFLEGQWESWPRFAETPGQLLSYMRGYDFQYPDIHTISIPATGSKQPAKDS